MRRIICIHFDYKCYGLLKSKSVMSSIHGEVSLGSALAKHGDINKIASTDVEGVKLSNSHGSAMNATPSQQLATFSTKPSESKKDILAVKVLNIQSVRRRRVQSSFHIDEFRFGRKFLFL